MGYMYGVITKNNDIYKNLLGMNTSPSQPLCPTNVPDASSGLKPVEVTLAGLVTVSNEMC